MHFNKVKAAALFIAAMFWLNSDATTSTVKKTTAASQKEVTVSTPQIKMVINLNHQVNIVALTVNDQKVINNEKGIFSSLRINGITYSSLALKNEPSVSKTSNTTKISGINYGDQNININETWVFSTSAKSIKWRIERTLSKTVEVETAQLPVFNFDSINTWEGAYQGYGGLAWFYLFNEPLSTYGVHTRSSAFWNSKTGTGLDIRVDAPGKNVAMSYGRTAADGLAYSITPSTKLMLPMQDSDTHRRLFVRKQTDVWAPFTIAKGTSIQNITLTYFDFNERYGRGKMAGINQQQVSAVLNTIARIGVIDSLHFGGNSWATPYGPICLHEQYIAQIGLGVNDEHYLKGYESCLDYYRDHAIKPDGRVYPRWAYNNEDAMPRQYNKEGFYEAQWGILMDSNPDLVSNIGDLYDMTGNKQWVKTHQLSCEKALNWILKRDGNHNGLVEVMTDSEQQKRGSDWIDIVWASFENAFINAKLYRALVKWADIEQQLNNPTKARFYRQFAARLKTSFNKPIEEGGFWDAQNSSYAYWRDKDGSIHGRNTVTPVDFMAIAYGICDDSARQKIILDAIEVQMQKEHLFFWPLAMYTYAPGEAKRSQYPFPSYENGDLFLSWGSVAIKAYATYKPELAVKYVKNVLAQYGKDGLAFQRYGRLKQDGLGDDILSGNSLSIVGLYQSIYGINPLYNRLYLDPHITPELAGTSLRYSYRGRRLTIDLDTTGYAITAGHFKIASANHFGFFASANTLSYFNGDNAAAALTINATTPLAIDIKTWDKDKAEWRQRAAKWGGKLVTYQLHQFDNKTTYKLFGDGRLLKKLQSDAGGNLLVEIPAGVNIIAISK